MKKNIVILTLIFLGTFIVMPAYAVTETKKKKDVPATIKADRMQYLKAENCMVLEDNVIIKLDDQSLLADKVIIFQGTDSKGKQEFSRAVATGNVVIKTPGRTLYGKKGVWEMKKKIIRITGDPILKLKSGQEISAEAIKYDIVLEKCTFEGAAKAKMSVTKDTNLDFDGF
ncbi:hypothetical protein KAH27_02890 [bacterium]|nr:hypothetical protein [bacterium]